MIFGQQLYRVVQTRPGPGTGETFYKTQDGRWWEVREPICDGTAIAVTGTLRNGYVSVP